MLCPIPMLYFDASRFVFSFLRSPPIDLRPILFCVAVPVCTTQLSVRILYDLERTHVRIMFNRLV
jgi:hypothetical protein